MPHLHSNCAWLHACVYVCVYIKHRSSAEKLKVSHSLGLTPQHMTRVGQDHIYTRCIYGMFGREITKYTVIYGAYNIHGSDQLYTWHVHMTPLCMYYTTLAGATCTTHPRATCLHPFWHIKNASVTFKRNPSVPKRRRDWRYAQGWPEPYKYTVYE